MRLDFPPKVERDIQQFARQEHITHDEAVLRLIETGLSARTPARDTVAEQGLGWFGSPEDSALLDEVVSHAYEEKTAAIENCSHSIDDGQMHPGYGHSFRVPQRAPSQRHHEGKSLC